MNMMDLQKSINGITTEYYIKTVNNKVHFVNIIVNCIS